MKIEFLEGTTQTGLKWRFPLRITPVRIGRSPAADVQIFDDDCGEIHVILTRTTQNWKLEAADPHRPVQLDGREVRKSIFPRGSYLTIGNTEIRLGAAGEKAAATSLDLSVRRAQDIYAIIETPTGQVVSRFLLGSQAMVLGRSSSADILIEGDTAVSGRHLSVSAQGEEILVEDLGSTNGTYIEDRRITAPTIITIDGFVSVGRLQLRFERA